MQRWPNAAGVAPRAASLIARILLVLIRGYKLVVSPHVCGACRFVPSCADYAREAVMRHGAVGGSWLALTRVVRCQPLCAAGLDPVPTPRLRRSGGTATQQLSALRYQPSARANNREPRRKRRAEG